MRDREDVAYLAGLYEGEGNICTRRDGKYNGTIAVAVRMSDKEPLDQLVLASGLGKVTGPHKSAGPVKDRDYKPMYSWNIYGLEKCQAFVAMAWPWLSPRRKSQAKDALSRATAGRLGSNQYVRNPL